MKKQSVLVAKASSAGVIICAHNDIPQRMYRHHTVVSMEPVRLSPTELQQRKRKVQAFRTSKQVVNKEPFEAFVFGNLSIRPANAIQFVEMNIKKKSNESVEKIASIVDKAMTNRTDRHYHTVGAVRGRTW